LDNESKEKNIPSQAGSTMSLAQDWNGVERRKARPSRDSIVELLNRFGTEYPQPEKNAVDFRRMYYELLARPWEQRGSGLPYRTVQTISIFSGFFLFLTGGALLVFLFSGGLAGPREINPLGLFAAGIWGMAILAVVIYGLSRLTINIRTLSHTFRKYPLVRRAALQLADSSKDEVVRDYIPILKINGKNLFQIVYIKKGDASKTPSGILILDDQGRAIWEYGVLESTKLTASISIICGHVLQQRADQLRRSMQNVLDHKIPDAVRILKKQERQFSEKGLAPRWIAVLEGASELPQALRESVTILYGEEGFRKAMGYAFALEFHYEDAQKLRKLYLDYIRFLNASYRRKIISLTTEAAMLIQILESKPDWREKNAALAALSTLAIAGTNSFLARLYQKEYEGVVNDGERKAYEEKTQQAIKMGWPVVSE
jgi:hypothetical protein